MDLESCTGNLIVAIDVAGVKEPFHHCAWSLGESGLRALGLGGGWIILPLIVRGPLSYYVRGNGGLGVAKKRGCPNGGSKRGELSLGSSLKVGPMVDTIHYEMSFDELIVLRYISNMQEALKADMDVRACFRQQCLCNLASSWEKCAIVKKLDFWWTLRLQQSFIFCPIVEGGVTNLSSIVGKPCRTMSWKKILLVWPMALEGICQPL
jgi:hypothetical protein